MLIVNDSIQVMKALCPDGVKRERLYLSFRSDSVLVGDFFTPFPSEIKKEKAKRCSWLIDFAYNPVEISEELMEVFEKERRLNERIEEYYSVLEEIAEGNVKRANTRIMKLLRGEGSVKSARKIAGRGLEVLCGMRREIEKARYGLANREGIEGIVVDEDARKAQMHMNFLREGRFCFPGIRRGEGSALREILGWTTAFSDIETKYFESEEDVPEERVEELRELDMFKGKDNEEINELARKEFRERKEAVTHIGILYRKEGIYFGEIHTTQSVDVDSVVAEMGGISASIRIISYEVGEDEVEKRYKEYCSLILEADEKKRKRINNKFGVIEREDNNEERIKQDIKASLEERRMRDGAERSWRLRNPFWACYHNAPFDIEGKKKIDRFPRRNKSWGIDANKRQPRKVGSTPFMEKERITNGVIVDTLQLARNYFPELRKRTLGSMVLHLNGWEMPEIKIDNGRRILTLEPKYITHRDINPLNLMAEHCEEGKVGEGIESIVGKAGERARKILLYYLAGDLVATAFIEERMREIEKVIINLGYFGRLWLGDLMHSPKVMEQVLERWDYVVHAKESDSTMKFFVKKAMSGQRKDFLNWFERGLGLAKEKKVPDMIHCVYIPYAYFNLDKILWQCQEISGLIRKRFDLKGEQRAQLVYEKMLEPLVSRIFQLNKYRESEERRRELVPFGKIRSFLLENGARKIHQVGPLVYLSGLREPEAVEESDILIYLGTMTREEFNARKKKN